MKHKSKKPVAFIRKMFTEIDNYSQKEFNRKTFDQNMAPIHYQNVRGLNPQDYKKEEDRRAIRKVKKVTDVLREFGGLIIDYGYSGCEDFKILKVKKGSEIQHCEDYTTNGEKIIFKYLEIESFKKFKKSDHLPLSSGLPVRGTLVMTRNHAGYINRLWCGHKLKICVSSLDVKNSELISFAYSQKMKYVEILLSQIGRNLEVSDFRGMDYDGKLTHSQTTFEKNQSKIINKINAMRDFSKTDKCYFFCLKTKFTESLIGKCKNIKIIFLEDVLNYFIRMNIKFIHHLFPSDVFDYDELMKKAR